MGKIRQKRKQQKKFENKEIELKTIINEYEKFKVRLEKRGLSEAR